MMPCVQARPGIAPECAPFKRQRVQCSRASLKRMLMHEETLWFLIVGAVLVLSIASGERASSALYFQKHVVDVELDRAVAF